MSRSDSEFFYPEAKLHRLSYLFLGKHETLWGDRYDLYVHVASYKFATCRYASAKNMFSLALSDATRYGSENDAYTTGRICINNLYDKTLDDTEATEKYRLADARYKAIRLEVLKRWYSFVFEHLINQELQTINRCPIK